MRLWALLPICLAVFGTVGIWVVFGIAVSNETVNITARFPYISECGTYDPQSCIFSQVCNICAVLILWVVVIRFQQVRDYGQNSKVNIASIVLGFISSLGISILGSFRQSVLFGIHVFGAFLAFFVGLAYFWLQVWLTYKVQPSTDRGWMGPLRAALSSICTILVITMAIGLFFDTGYRSMASISEWALVMCFFVLFGLFASEFRHVDCHLLTGQNQGLSKTQSINSGIAETFNITERFHYIRSATSVLSWLSGFIQHFRVSIGILSHLRFRFGSGHF